MDFATAKIQLNLTLNNTLLQLTDDQVVQALTEAWNDGYVTKSVWDSSLAFSQSAFQYTLPAGVTTVSDIYLERDTQNFPEPISGELWEVVGTTLNFNRDAKLRIPDSTTLYIKGRYKLTTSDSLTTPRLQNYVLSLASYIALKPIGFSKVMGFLRNDTTLAEVIAYRREIQQDMMMYRQQLHTEYVAN